MRRITEIIVHCAATRPNWMQDATIEEKRDEIKRWHMIDNGWRDIGYHYLIDRDGKTVGGRPLEDQGAHTAGHNSNSIGVCLIGGHGSAVNDPFDAHFTDAQDQALRVLIDSLKTRFPSIVKVSGHNDYTAAKACPGFKVGRWLANKPPARPLAASTTLQATGLQLGSAAGGVWGAITQLDGTDRTMALIFIGIIAAASIWIARERFRKWLLGVQ